MIPMPPVSRTCKITGATFEVSELEQKLRAKFDVPLPDVHPYERMRELMAWRNIMTLYPHKCDLCGVFTLCFYNPTTTFPKYCKKCFYSDQWEPPFRDIDFSRSFFPQLAELYNATPSMALSTAEPMVNSDFCNAATGLKNCYMCFNAGFCEGAIYTNGGMYNKDTVDLFAIGNSELCYECMGGGFLYGVRWSENVMRCIDSSFLYDCENCHDCFMSAGLRHKRYVFRGRQLSKEEYKRAYAAIDTGSHQVIAKLKEEYTAMKKECPKRYLIGIKNENVSGNYLYGCKDTHDSYFMDSTENCLHCYDLLDNTKDCLDVCAYGYGLECAYLTTSAGGGSFNIRYSFVAVEKSLNLEYCMECRNCSDCFGCAGLRKKQYCILNKPYPKEEYMSMKERLIAHMRETGEYGQFLPKKFCPFGYNETTAHYTMPMTKEEALKRGFKWYEKEIPEFPPEQIYAPPDHIDEVKWDELNGKVIICEESKRPFKVITQEFEFYKKYRIPLPRLHPEVRMAKRYPTGELYNLHTTPCAVCKGAVTTSMPREATVLCEACYQKARY